MRLEPIKDDATMNKTKITILGGGTAGWMTAIALKYRWDEKVEVQLIESPQIGIIGVGEGSTPRLKHFFDSVGVDENEWMPKCNASYKNGISFVGWSSKPGCKSYFHPFASFVDKKTQSAFFYNALLKRKGFDVETLPDKFFLTAYLAENKLAPIAQESFPFEVDYGYHFDSQKLGEYLRERSIGMGVKHIQDEIDSVELDGLGNIEALTSNTGDRYKSDLFVDCSGFKSVLMQQSLAVPFVSFSDNLINDSAVVMPTPQQEQLHVQTISTALNNGWAWYIPLQNRNGNGYVYSSRFTDAEQAERELRDHLGSISEGVEARHLKLKVGRCEKHWHRNCLAVGLSQGFIEPLEATALNLVANTIDDFIATFEESGVLNSENAANAKCLTPKQLKQQDAFNQRVNHGFEAIRDYIVAHYVLNSRSDTEYWVHCREKLKVSPTLQKIVNCWTHGANLGQEIEQNRIATSYTVTSWYSLLSGYGVYPEQSSLRLPTEEMKQHDMHETEEFLRRCGLNFLAHNDVLRSSLR